MQLHSLIWEISRRQEIFNFEIGKGTKKPHCQGTGGVANFKKSGFWR